MNIEEFKTNGHKMVDWMYEYLRDIEKYPIKPNIKPKIIYDSLPNKAPFELALKKLDLSASECWMIGDSLDADVLGGNECGLVTLHKYESRRAIKYKNIIPDASFDDFDSIIKLIKKIEVEN